MKINIKRKYLINKFRLRIIINKLELLLNKEREEMKINDF